MYIRKDTVYMSDSYKEGASYVHNKSHGFKEKRIQLT